MKGKHCFGCQHYKQYYNSNEYFCAKGWCVKIRQNNKKK